MKGKITGSFMTLNDISSCNGSTCDMGYGPGINDASTELTDQFVMYGRSNGEGSTTDSAKPQGLFTPVNAAAIDNKIDDGMPNTGKVFAYVRYPNNMSPPSGYNAQCVAPYDFADITAKYKTSETTLACGMAFLLVRKNNINLNF